MNEEEMFAFGVAGRFHSRPMRGSKQIQGDVRRGGPRRRDAGGGRLPFYPPFQPPADPSYR